MIYKKITIIGLVLIYCLAAYSQQLLTFDAARTLALSDTYQSKVAEAIYNKSKAMRKAGTKWDNPTITYESPTGEFMTLGVQQTIAIPTVYGLQKKLARINADYLANEASMSKAQARYIISSHYLDVQYHQALASLWSRQLAILEDIVQKSSLSFQAGQDDFLVLSNAKNQRNMAQQAFTRAQIQQQTSEQQLIQSLNINTASLTVDSMVLYDQIAATTDITSNNSWAQNQATLATAIAQQEVKLTKAQQWPSFVLGYQNQSDASTPFKYRLSFGLQLPIWIWQNKASVNLTKANEQFTISQATSNIKSHNTRLNLITTELSGLRATMDYYKNFGTTNIQEMTSTSMRMYNAGQITMIHHLDNLSKSFDIRIQHLDDIKSYNDLLIEREYLSSK